MSIEHKLTIDAKSICTVLQAKTSLQNFGFAVMCAHLCYIRHEIWYVGIELKKYAIEVLIARGKLKYSAWNKYALTLIIAASGRL